MDGLGQVYLEYSTKTRRSQYWLLGSPKVFQRYTGRNWTKRVRCR